MRDVQRYTDTKTDHGETKCVKPLFDQDEASDERNGEDNESHGVEREPEPRSVDIRLSMLRRTVPYVDEGRTRPIEDLGAVKVGHECSGGCMHERGVATLRISNFLSF